MLTPMPRTKLSRRHFFAVLGLASCVGLGACSTGNVDNEESARRAYLGFDGAIDRALKLGFDGYNAASNANIPEQSEPGDESGTMVVGGQVDRGADAHAFRGRPAEQFPCIQNLVGRARSIDNVDAFQPVPVRERPIDDRAGRCEAQPAGDDHQILAERALDRPGGAQGTAHADPLPL